MNEQRHREFYIFTYDLDPSRPRYIYRHDNGYFYYCYSYYDNSSLTHRITENVGSIWLSNIFNEQE